MQDKRADPLAESDLARELYQLVSQANSCKSIKKGANEATKNVNRLKSELVIIAADTNPLEIVLHLPLICEQKNIPYVFVASKKKLGKACGSTRNVIAVSLVNDKASPLRQEIMAMRDRCERLFATNIEEQ